MGIYSKRALSCLLAVAQILVPRVSLGAEEACQEGSSFDPPFLLSDAYLMGNENFENFRFPSNVRRIQSYIPKRSLVRLLKPGEMDRHGPLADIYFGVEVLSIPGNSRTPTPLAQKGDRGLVHGRSLIRQSAEAMESSVFEVKQNSPFYHAIAEAGATSGAAIKLVTVGEPGRKKFKTQECCRLDARGKSTSDCRTNYVYAVLDSAGNGKKEIAVPSNADCSVLNFLEAKTAPEIRSMQQIAQRALLPIESISGAEKNVPLGGLEQVRGAEAFVSPPHEVPPVPRGTPAAAPLSAPPPAPALRVDRSATIAPNEATPQRSVSGGSGNRYVDMRALRARFYPTRPAPSEGGSAAPAAPPPPASPVEPSASPGVNLAALVQPIPAQTSSRCRNCPQVRADMVRAQLGPVLQSDGHTYRMGPFGSVHYYLTGRQNVSFIGRPESMCSFLSTLRDYKTSNIGSSKSIFVNDFYSPISERLHVGHGTGECVDVRPVSKSKPSPGNYAPVHVGSANYDRAATAAMIRTARANGATGIMFCDAAAGPDIVDCRGHRNHVHLCYRKSSGRLSQACVSPNPEMPQTLTAENERNACSETDAPT